MFCSESKTDFDCNSGKVPLVGKKNLLLKNQISNLRKNFLFEMCILLRILGFCYQNNSEEYK